METLYDVLEVSRKASKEVIEKAYKTLAKKYHPDVQMPENKAKAEEMMKRINEAYGILSDDQKRKEYDAKLEAEEQRNIPNNNYNNSSYSTNNYYYKPQNNKTQYSNTTYNKNTNSYSQAEYNNDLKSDNWREAYSKLSKKEQKKIKKKIEKEANEEYRKMYEDYLRSRGYRVKHKWTFKEFLSIVLAIMILVIILLVLWWIPPTHEWMVNMYENNIAIKMIADIIIGMCRGMADFFKK